MRSWMQCLEEVEAEALHRRRGRRNQQQQQLLLLLLLHRLPSDPQICSEVARRQ
jgi:hypothetical protein